MKKSVRSAHVFYLKLLREFDLVFGIYYKNSFDLGNIYWCLGFITKIHLIWEISIGEGKYHKKTWCSTPPEMRK